MNFSLLYQMYCNLPLKGPPNPSAIFPSLIQGTVQDSVKQLPGNQRQAHSYVA